MSLRHQRILSAHHGSVPSGNPRRRYQKMNTEVSQSNFRQVSQGSKKRSESYFRKGRETSKHLPKEPEQILEQNLNLKSFISNLQEQLTMQKNKLEITKRKNEKYMKQVNREFEKQIYYSGKNPNSYLISGVKSQYEHIKNLYEEKCSQLDNILKTLDNTDLQELKLYIETLETQNINLVEQLTAMKNIKSSFNEIYAQDFKVESNIKGIRSFQQNNNGKLQTENSEDKSEETNKHVEVLIGMLADERANLGRANSLIQRYSEKIEAMSKEREELKKKIEFLQKLTIEKDNNQHEARREFKKVERENNQLLEEIIKLKALVNSTEILCQNKVKNIQETSTKRFQIQKSIFERTLNQKNQYISKLEKQIRSLSAMLCYWKPLDQKNDAQSSLSRHDSPKSRDPREFEKEDKVSSLRFNPQSQHNRRQSVVSDHSFLGADLPNKNESEMQRSMRVNREQEGFLKRTVTGNRSNSYQNAISAIKEKPRKECSRKYTENAKKTRKVDLNSIKEWGELLRYRLIGQNISLDQVKDYFKAAEEVEFEDYITMKQIKAILMKTPFSLKQQEATLISRYVVQDSANEFVYWDEQNQIYRNIAKSIIKTVIGDYELPDLKRIREQWDKVKKMYLPNIMSALKTIAPKGLVTLTKFSELILGLGIELTDALQEWIIGELVVNSESMEELKYELIEKL